MTTNDEMLTLEGQLRLIDEGLIPKSMTCPFCHGFGHKGMDNCNRCSRTGSVFMVGGIAIPNTAEGYVAALKRTLKRFIERQEHVTD